ncbi:homeodomain-like protein [Tanacetum coccineum]
MTIPFPSHLYDDGYDEEEGSYVLKDLDVYSVGTTLLDDALPTKEKDPESFTLPYIINNLCFNKALADLGASISVMPFLTYTKLGLGELAPTKLIVELADRIVKRPKGIEENVLVRIDKFVFPARLMGEALILNRSLDPLYGHYIGLNDLNDPLELRRNQVDDLEPTIEEGEVVDEPIMDIVKTRFYNAIMKDKVEYKGKNVVGTFMNVPIFVGKFSIVADFAVVENMDAYRNDDGMGDIIFGRPFCRQACVKTRWFNGMITIYKGNDSVSAQDELKGISHPYQKLKGFYKEVLDLGSEYIKNKKVEEWFKHGHTIDMAYPISMDMAY